MSTDANVVVVGGGIVGLATARILQQRGFGPVLVIDKEPEIARHQSGHNSGVVHSGIYYRPGSAKAELVRASRAPLERLVADHGIAFERCGKLILATRPGELAALDRLASRAVHLGLDAYRLHRAGIHDVEPFAEGLAALHVPATAITDYPAICRALAAELIDAGGEVRCSSAVENISVSDGHARIELREGALRANWLVNCAGLYSDRIARLAGVDPGVEIVPFRGEYFTLSPDAARRVRHLIYPVPDDRFPFLGVHLTRMIGGGIHAGPNAVLALAREGYRWGAIERRQVRATTSSAGLRRLAARHWRMGGAEVVRSISRRRFAAALSRLVPGIEAADLERAPAGVRAQAIRPDGTLVDDFVMVDGPRSVHVVNAPSPAATASLGIADAVADRLSALMARRGAAPR